MKILFQRHIFATAVVASVGLASTVPANALTSDEAMALADMTRAATQRIAVQQAVMALSSESSDIDGDGYIESPVILAGAGPVGGGIIPLSSAAPKDDSYGTKLGYCAWDNGSNNSSGGRITGVVNGYSAPVFAVISSGIDNVFQTSCADIAAGTGAKGDDFLIAYNSTQLQMGTSGTLFFGDPVADVTALNALNAGSLKDGQVRLTKATNALYRWNAGTTTWVSVGSGLPWVASGAGYVSNSQIAAMGGNAIGLANGAYFFRVGSEPGLNVAYDYSGIQARNNGVAAALNLNPLGGNVNVGGNMYAKDITASRGDGTGVIFLNGANTRYVYFDGTQYQMPGANLYVNGSQAWTQATLTNLNQLTNGPGYITAAQAPVQSVFGRTGNVVMNSGDVTTALGYVPVNRAGDTMSAALGFTAPGTTATIGPGNGDGASSTTNNFALKSWYGIGFGPNITGQPVANGSYSHWFNVRTGDMGMAGTLTAQHIIANSTGTIGGAAQTAYDIGAGRIAAGQSIYSYGSICVGNSSGDCTGTGGAVLTASNMTIGGNTVITSANGNMLFHWAGQGGQPAWLWGGNASTDMYVYNPSNFSVNYANTAGSANTLANGATIGDVYSNGWYRSNGQAGWYSQTYGGGIYMVDSSWVRAYNGKGLLTDNYLYAGAGLYIAGNVAIDGARNFNGGAVTASNYVQPGNIAGNGWGCAAAGSIGRDGSGNLYVCN